MQVKDSIAILSFLEREADDCKDEMLDRTERHLPFTRKQDVYVYFVTKYKVLHTKK